MDLPAGASLFPAPGAASTGGLSPPSTAAPSAPAAPVLLLNVWSCPPEATAAAAPDPGSAAAGEGRGRASSPLAAGPAGEQQHLLIGCAAADLTTLPLLGELRGFFNIVDYAQQVGTSHLLLSTFQMRCLKTGSTEP